MSKIYPMVGDRPATFPYIENERFWDLDAASLRYIMADCDAAIKANPANLKNYTGPKNYADQINDACTVIGWRNMLHEREDVILKEND